MESNDPVGPRGNMTLPVFSKRNVGLAFEGWALSNGRPLIDPASQEARKARRGWLKGLFIVIDETTRKCLAIEMARSFTAQDVIGVLQYLFAVRGTPQHIRSDNGPDFVAKTVRRWLQRADVGTRFIAKGSPWENGYVESADGKLRDELLNQELFLSCATARWVIDRWQLDYNHHRLHSALNYWAPAAYAAGCVLLASVTPQYPEYRRVT